MTGQRLKRKQSKLCVGDPLTTTYTYFITCTRIKKIWTHYQTILTELIGKRYTRQQHLLTLNFSNTNKYTRKLTLAIIQIILFKIWQSRNKSKYDKTLLPQHTFDTHQTVTCPKLTKINWLST